MRWLFLLLVVLNLMLYLHHVTRAPVVIASNSVGLEFAPKEAGIKLLTESEPPARRVATQLSGNTCLFLGGFDEESAALSIEQRLLSLDIESNAEPLDMAAGVDYWVYLPPLISRQASLRQLKELQSRNIDSYIITVGELSNGISLGIFSRKDSAESVVSRLQSVDYAAQIKELARTHRTYWVRVSADSQRLITESLLEELLRDFSVLEQKQMACSGIATS